MNRRAFVKKGLLFVPCIVTARKSLAQLPVIPFNPVSNSSCATGTTVVSSWATRVVTNGGAAPSAGTKSALTTFVCALDAAAVWSKMIAVNAIVPDNIIAMRTPLLVGPGIDPWTTLPSGAFAGGQLTTAGLAGDGTHYLSTGIGQTATGVTSTSAGMSMYAPVTGANGVIAGCQNGSSVSWTFAAHYPSFTLSFIDEWNDTGATDRASVAQNTAGFYSGSRTSNTVLKIYFATSGTAFSNVGSSSGTMVGSPNGSAGVVYLMGLNVAGTSVLNISSGTCSFFAIHQGLSSGDTQTLYNATQALRVSLGGGYL